MALNQFAVMTAEEFAATHLGASPDRPGDLRERATGEDYVHYVLAQSAPAWSCMGISCPF